MNVTIIKKRVLNTSFHEEEDGTAVMTFEGWFDTAASVQAKRDMDVLQDLLDHNIVLDLTNLKYISSSGLRLFLGLLKTAKPKGSHVYITGLNDDLRQVFTMTGFINLFEFK